MASSSAGGGTSPNPRPASLLAGDPCPVWTATPRQSGPRRLRPGPAEPRLSAPAPSTSCTRRVQYEPQGSRWRTYPRELTTTTAGCEASRGTDSSRWARWHDEQDARSGSRSRHFSREDYGIGASRALSDSGVSWPDTEHEFRSSGDQEALDRIAPDLLNSLSPVKVLQRSRRPKAA